MCNTEVLKSDPCDYNDAYILVKCNITISRNIPARAPFKNCVSFAKCVTKRLMEEQ